MLELPWAPHCPALLLFARLFFLFIKAAWVCPLTQEVSSNVNILKISHEPYVFSKMIMKLQRNLIIRHFKICDYLLVAAGFTRE